jgi:hypothetical protein
MNRVVRSALAALAFTAFVGAARADEGEGSPQPPDNYNPNLPAEGLTLGYWKNHSESWPTTYWFAGVNYNLSPNSLIGDVFPSDNFVNGIDGMTLMDALNFRGGPGIAGAECILLKQAVAALLNASSRGNPLEINYPLEEWDVITMVTIALDSDDRATMLSLAGSLDEINSLELSN